MKTGILIGYFEPLHLGHLADINHATGQTDTLHVVILPKDGDSLFKPTLQDKARAVQVACGFFDFVKVHTAQSLNLTDLHGQAWAYDEPNSDTSVISLIISSTPYTFMTIPHYLSNSHLPIIFSQIPL